MRFDYQPPITQYKSLRLRRWSTISLVLTGLGCVILALFTNSTSDELLDSKNNTAPLKRPVILSKLNDKKILSLESSVYEAEKKILASLKKDQVLTEALAAEQHTIKDKWHTITVQVGDTLSVLFKKLGLSNNTLNRIISSGPNKSELYNIYPGQTVDFLLDDSKELQKIKFNLSNTKALHVAKTEDGFTYHYEETEPTKKLNFSSAKISGSLYATAQNAGLGDRLIMQLAEIFGCDIDFSLDIRDNDSFKVLYEEEYIRDQKIDSGNIIAAEFKNQGKLFKAIRYTDADGHSGYYSPEGESMQKSFLRSPVVFTRISSHFSNARRHPILHKLRSHKGVDYAAPTGTPVKSAGDGRISFIGTKGGYGKSIEITHGQRYSTFYAHLSKFAKKLKHGSTIKQGEVIGYVGKTGLATGPHLHYEFRIDGVHHNPVTVSLPRTKTMPNKIKNEFSQYAVNMMDLLNSHSMLAKND